MKLVEMTNSSKPLALGDKGNVRIPERDVERLERMGFERARVPNLKGKKELKDG